MADQFLFVCLPDRGHVFPNLAVATELARRGHDVTFVTGASLTDRVSAPDVRFVFYESELDKLDAGATTGAADLASLPVTLVRESTKMLPVVGDDVPSVVVGDMATPVAWWTLARKWPCPVVETVATFASNNHYSWLGSMMELIGAPTDVDMSAPPPALAEMASMTTELLTEHGLDVALPEFITTKPDHTLVFIPRSFQPAGETFDDSFSFVGPCLGERSFLGGWQPPANGLPVVLASLGTMNSSPDFFRRCVAAFRGVPWHLVLTVGDGVAPASLGPLPDNVEVHSWISHLDVLAHARVFVTHGGTGSMMEAFLNGCPVVATHGATPAEQLNAQRAAELGLGGQVTSAADITPDGLRDAVLRVAQDSEIQRRVKEMREQILAAGGTARAADELEACAEHKPAAGD